MATRYTVDNIRHEQPKSIKVKCKKETFDGRIIGWMRDFPRVVFGPANLASVEVSVETLCHCLNDKLPLDVA